jgi:hypothetical protein
MFRTLGEPSPHISVKVVTKTGIITICVPKPRCQRYRVDWAHEQIKKLLG